MCVVSSGYKQEVVTYVSNHNGSVKSKSMSAWTPYNLLMKILVSRDDDAVLQKNIFFYQNIIVLTIMNISNEFHYKLVIIFVKRKNSCVGSSEKLLLGNLLFTNFLPAINWAYIKSMSISSATVTFMANDRCILYFDRFIHSFNWELYFS